MRLKVRNVIGALVFLLATYQARCAVRLPQLVSSGMVLQRDAPVKLWGWADPDEQLQITFKGKRVKTHANREGKWVAWLPAMPAGGPFTMQIDATNHITLTDILIGDVWLMSGQSNMTILMERVKERYPQDIANANYPQIRNFFIPTSSDVRALHNDFPASQWVKADPKSVLNFGAVAFFMTRALFEKYHVPMGIINASVGGTPIQAWISAEGISQVAGYGQRVAQFKDSSFFNQFNKLPTKPTKVKTADPGLVEQPKWFDSAYQPGVGWHRFWLPGYWADQGVRGLNGVVWFRKVIDVPAAMAGHAAKLFMGRIIDADETYVNGQLIGNITYQYPPRRYNIPAGLLKAGKNTVVVRVTNTAGKGGFVPDKRYELTDGSTTLDLRGDWQYRVGQVFDDRLAALTVPRNVFIAQSEPTGLYNTMISPAVGYGIRGMVWYQGESNIGTKDYSILLKTLVADWRDKWKLGPIPFFVVQLPNFGDVQYSPSESGWAEIREAQADVLTLPNTTMAVTIDAGEWNDIHPLNKKTVGERLSLAAEALVYHQKKVVASGPTFIGATVQGADLEVEFSHTGSGLVAVGDTILSGFAIAGYDRKFVWAKARISGNKVILSNPDVKSPVYVRYAWADNPEGANLYNREGLPAAPFRTDRGK